MIFDNKPFIIFAVLQQSV